MLACCCCYCCCFCCCSFSYANALCVCMRIYMEKFTACAPQNWRKNEEWSEMLRINDFSHRFQAHKSIASGGVVNSILCVCILFSLWLTTTVLSPSGSHVSVYRKYIRWKSVDCFSIICSTTIHRSSIHGGEWISPIQAQPDNEHNYILKLHTLYGIDCKQNNRRVVAVNECVEMSVPQVRHTSSYCNRMEISSVACAVCAPWFRYCCESNLMFEASL